MARLVPNTSFCLQDFMHLAANMIGEVRSPGLREIQRQGADSAGHLLASAGKDRPIR